jgi:hypothetical protein
MAMGLVLVLAFFAGCTNQKPSELPGANDKPADTAAPPPSEAAPAPQALPEGHPAVEKMDPAMEAKVKEDVKREVAVPAAVQGKWAAVKLSVKNKETGQVTEIEAPLDTKTALPGTDLTIKPAYFLPSFIMQEGSISSVNNDPNNPAVKIYVRQGTKTIHEGWIFQRFPEVHPFENPKIELRLLGGVPVAAAP